MNKSSDDIFSDDETQAQTQAMERPAAMDAMPPNSQSILSPNPPHPRHGQKAPRAKYLAAMAARTANQSKVCTYIRATLTL